MLPSSLAPVRTAVLRASAAPLAARAALRPAALRPPHSLQATWLSSRSSRPRLAAVQLPYRRSLADSNDAKGHVNPPLAGPKLDDFSAASTAPSLTHNAGDKHEEEHEVSPWASVRQDVNTIKETFSLSEVPRQAYVLGLAGVLPYLATSMTTLYCAWEINHAAATNVGFLLSEPAAEALLHFLEPIQVGYGAVILSFLGAIHWGLEWAGYGGYQGYRRYMIGVLAPAIAWPTILMPIEGALVTQFFAFVMLYYADTRATYKGWTPSWYAIYRFVLTFIVGASIVFSLVERGHVAHRVGTAPGAMDRILASRDSVQQSLMQQEEAARIVAEEEDSESSEDGESGADGESANGDE